MRTFIGRPQFRLKHLIVTTTIIAILTQPAILLVQTVWERLQQSPSTTVSVPDGGTILIGGIVIRPDGTRAVEPRKTMSKVEFSMATSTIIIQEEPEPVYLPMQ